MIPFTIDERIEHAETLPAELYRDPHWFETIKEKVLARTWHCLGYESDFHHNAHPLTLLPGVLNEPLLLTKSDGERRLLSNVCTHRGMLVVTEAGQRERLRCGYHGRCFNFDGCFKSMPVFQEAEDFPREVNNLSAVPFFNWKGLVLASLNPIVSGEELFEEVEKRVGFLDFESAVIDPKSDRDYEVNANWMLYCDNYLEGFHIPFVHPSLATALDYSQYRTELFPWGSVQIGIAAEGEPCFDFPAGHQYAGQRIAGFYFCLFPGTILNVYPWGVSLNFILPKAFDKTTVRYRALVWDETKREQGAGTNL
ncbi:MAG: SRPBCC family protein, partial [Planctomycetota bacterium]|nr:SRPBCC family protein [Planctomycetota bacterium]